MLNKPPSYAREKAWLDRVTEYGCVITREKGAIQRHHVLGREARSQKLHIGRWFVIPLATRLHDINYPEELTNVTHHKKTFVREYGKQSDLFYAMCMEIKKQDGRLPFDDEILNAIMATGA